MSPLLEVLKQKSKTIPIVKTSKFPKTFSNSLALIYSALLLSIISFQLTKAPTQIHSNKIGRHEKHPPTQVILENQFRD